MKKIKFYDVTKVTATHLNELRRRLEEAILVRTAQSRSVGTFGKPLGGTIQAHGIVAGLAIVNDPDDARNFAITNGNAFTPRGDLVVLASQSGLTTYDWVTITNRNNIDAGETAYVYLHYSEVEEGNADYKVVGKYDGITKDMSLVPQISILPLKIPPTSLTQHNTPHGEIPDDMVYIGSFTAPDIEAGEDFNTVAATITRPTLPDRNAFLYVASVTDPIPGVEMGQPSPEIQRGTGLVEHQWTSTDGHTLRFQGPGAGEYGAAQAVTADGTYTLPSGSGSLTVFVEFNLLNELESEVATIEIKGLYDPDIPIWSHEDWRHRLMLGSGTPDARNPHGLHVQDIDGALSSSDLEIHQDLQHTNGIDNNSPKSTLAPQVVEDPDTGVDIIQVTVPQTYGYYINGVRHESIKNDTVSFGTAASDPTELYTVYIDEEGNLARELRARMPDSAELPGIEIVAVDDRIGATDYAMQYVYTSDTDRTLAFSADGGATYGPKAALVYGEDAYYRLYDGTGVNWVDVAIAWALLPDHSIERGGGSFAAVSSENKLLIAHVVRRGTQLGDILSGSALEDRRLRDLRQFGSVGAAEITIAGRQELAELPRLELRGTGVARGLTVSRVAGTTSVVVEGGVCYISGRRREMQRTQLDLQPGNPFASYHIVAKANGTIAAIPATDVSLRKDGPNRIDTEVLLAIVDVDISGNVNVHNVALRMHLLDRHQPVVVVAEKAADGHYSVETDGSNAIQNAIDYLVKHSVMGGTVFLRNGTYSGHIRLYDGIQLIGESSSAVIQAVDTVSGPVITNVGDNINRLTSRTTGLGGHTFITSDGQGKLTASREVFGILDGIDVGDTIYIYTITTDDFGFYKVTDVLSHSSCLVDRAFPNGTSEDGDGGSVDFALASFGISIRNLTIDGNGVELIDPLMRFGAVVNLVIDRCTFIRNNYDAGDTASSKRHVELFQCYDVTIDRCIIMNPADTSRAESMIRSERSELHGIYAEGCRVLRMRDNQIQTLERGIEIDLGGQCNIDGNHIAKCEEAIVVKNQSTLAAAALTGGSASPMPTSTLTALTGLVLPSGPSGVWRIEHYLSALRMLRLTGLPSTISDISGVSGGFFYGAMSPNISGPSSISGPSGFLGLSGIRRVKKRPPFRPRRGLAAFGSLFGNPARFGERPGPGGSVTTSPMHAMATQIALQEGFTTVLNNVISDCVIVESQISDKLFGKSITLQDSAGIIMANNYMFEYVYGLYLSGGQLIGNMILNNLFANRAEDTSSTTAGDVFVDDGAGITSNIWSGNKYANEQGRLRYVGPSGSELSTSELIDMTNDNLDMETANWLGIDEDWWQARGFTRAAEALTILAFSPFESRDIHSFLGELTDRFLLEHDASGQHLNMITRGVTSNDGSIDVIRDGSGNVYLNTSSIVTRDVTSDDTIIIDRDNMGNVNLASDMYLEVDPANSQTFDSGSVSYDIDPGDTVTVDMLIQVVPGITTQGIIGINISMHFKNTTDNGDDDANVLVGCRLVNIPDNGDVQDVTTGFYAKFKVFANTSGETDVYNMSGIMFTKSIMTSTKPATHVRLTISIAEYIKNPKVKLQDAMGYINPYAVRWYRPVS